MAKYRETPCRHYLALGQCEKGREACHKGYCQKCDKYVPRVRERHLNKKKQKILELKKREY